uniref:NDR1/HIN1-like protein 1 n=1 Tax=Erigeron canadensis TaxID=72917 RepID=UPI001CB8AEF2|nr:NDR1/HIN1-like protein 1 [Erigeron canadensis]
MGDTAYPQSKPPSTTTPTTIKPPPPQPPPQTKNPNLNRHPYRPNPNIYHRNRRKSYFCLICFWSILILILILLLATIAGCIVYLLYRPHRPTFAISSLKISHFNLTNNADDTTHLTTNMNITLSTKNPNKKAVFYYDPFAITCLTKDTHIANGSFINSFTSDPNNITIIRASLFSTSLLLETSTSRQISSDLKKKSGLSLKITLDTEARVKIESLRTKKVGIRIECDGIHSQIPKVSGGGNGGGKNKTALVPPTAVAANVGEAKCDVELRIKIWKWTFSS